MKNFIYLIEQLLVFSVGLPVGGVFCVSIKYFKHTDEQPFFKAGWTCLKRVLAFLPNEESTLSMWGL